MNELALFAGGGGGILASKLLGHNIVCGVELNSACARRLMQRQNEGHISPFPIWDDVCSFDGRPWRGIVDIVSGGFPCQDISPAGKKAGITGERSGLWFQQKRIISEVDPYLAFIENSSRLVKHGLIEILRDLAELGFDAEWGIIGANCAAVGAPHQRKRTWILASNAKRLPKRSESRSRTPRRVGRFGKPVAWNEHWETSLSRIRGVADGVARRVDRTDAVRNGQVPGVAAYAFSELLNRLLRG